MKIIKHDIKNGGALLGSLIMTFLMLVCTVGIAWSVVSMLGIDYWLNGAMFFVLILFPLYYVVKFYRLNVKEIKQKEFLEALEIKYSMMYNRFIDKE